MLQESGRGIARLMPGFGYGAVQLVALVVYLSGVRGSVSGQIYPLESALHATCCLQMSGLTVAH
jgi:hypothetical protein